MNITIQKPELKMIHKPISYRFIVSTELEEKIRYYLRKFPDVEYSGTLFYKVSGGFEDKSLVVTGIDFLLQDIGTSAYTEFEQSPDVIAYMVDHPELLSEDVQHGLMHSHHTLGAFFSGTDVNTLREEGTDRTHFVSLIIDTKGTYKAAITRIVEEVMTSTGRVKYNTFGSKEKYYPLSYKYTKKYIEWFYLIVEMPQYTYVDPFEELSNRVLEVQKQKAAKPKPAYMGHYGQFGMPQGGYSQSIQTTQPYKGASGMSIQTSVGNMIPKNVVSPVLGVKSELPFEEDYTGASMEDDAPPAYGNIHVNPIILETAAKQLLCGTVIIDENNKIDLDKFASSVKSIYDKRFESIHSFEEWASQHIEFILYDVYDDGLKDFNVDNLAAIVAYELIARFNQFPKNEYITKFIELLEHYII